MLAVKILAWALLSIVVGSLAVMLAALVLWTLAYLSQ